MSQLRFSNPQQLKQVKKEEPQKKPKIKKKVKTPIPTLSNSCLSLKSLRQALEEELLNILKEVCFRSFNILIFLDSCTTKMCYSRSFYRRHARTCNTIFKIEGNIQYNYN